MICLKIAVILSLFTAGCAYGTGDYGYSAFWLFLAAMTALNAAILRGGLRQLGR